jgi:hypothetical protein
MKLSQTKAKLAEKNSARLAKQLGLKGELKPGDMITKSNAAIANGLRAVKGTSKRAVAIKGLL